MKLKINMKNNPNLIAKNSNSLREAFGKVLTKISKTNKRIIVLDADIAGGTGLHHFKKKFKKRFIQCGIAEQNMMAMAGSLSLLGFIPVVTTFSVFMLRAFEQARLSIAYSNLNVKIVASHPGLDVGPDGASAQCLEDLACFRSLPNFSILSPCDSNEIELATKSIISHKGPIYMRTGRSESETFFNKRFGFEIGKGRELISGSQFYIIGCGATTLRAYKAALKLKKINISVGVINMSTIKPIDHNLLKKVSKKVKAILTVEDHSVYGGLGSAVAESLSKTKVDVFIKGMNTFGESGEPDELAKKYGIDENSIYKEIIKIKNNYDKS